MSLITPSYFYGDIEIAQLNQQAVADAVQSAIDRYEAEYLEALLGYEMYQQFINGLAAPVVEQKWLDLRDGVTFTYNSRQYRWPGFTSANVFAPFVPTTQDLVITVGSTAGVMAGATAFTLPELAGTSFSLERRVFGTMIEGADYSRSNAGQTVTLLQPGDTLQPGEVFIVHYAKRNAATAPVDNTRSSIAYYVYFMYQREIATYTAGVGQITPKAENSTRNDSTVKQATAWNKMVRLHDILFLFLQQNEAVYNWYDFRPTCNDNLRYQINAWSI